MEIYFKNSKKLLDVKIHLYLFFLFRNIFLSKKGKQDKQQLIEEKLQSMTDQINKKMFQNQKDKYIKIEYSIDNFFNIIDFIKMQNKNYAAEIVEDILIYIFSQVIQVDKTKTFGKYIFNNLYQLNLPNYKSELLDWFKKAKDMFNNEELKNFKQLLENDCSYSENNNNNNTSPLYQLIRELYVNKNFFLECLRAYKHTKTFNYINRSKTGFDAPIIESLNESKEKTLTMCDSVPENKDILPVKEFLVSVFIYYQNKHSPLMNYIPKKNEKKNDDIKMIINDKKNENNLADIPFEYDLRDANIESYHTKLIFAPLRIEPRISIIALVKNKLKDLGLFELSKMLLFNPNIKKIEYNQVVLKSYLMEYFNLGISLFDDYSVEELNLSSNYLNEDCGEFLSKILSHLKGLKTLNLSNTDLKSSASTLFITLKKLYRSKKSNLENLYLNKCALDDTSLYELGELLRSKYCKLKKLFLSSVNKSITFSLLEKIKDNRSLEELNLTRSNYDNTDINDIKRIMNCTNIKHLYISKNKINNFDNCLRIIYRTKLTNEKLVEKDKKSKGEEIEIIKERNKEDIIMGNKPFLINLDMSNNEAWILNENHAHLLHKIIYETTLSCLDVSHIMFGAAPDKNPFYKRPSSYKNYINKIKDYLEEKTNYYQMIYGEKQNNKVDIKRSEKQISESKFKDLIEDIEEKFGNDIDQIIGNIDAIYWLYLINNAEEIIQKIKNRKEYSKINDKINLELDNNNKEFKVFLATYMRKRKAEYDLIKNKKDLEKKKLILI